MRAVIYLAIGLIMLGAAVLGGLVYGLRLEIDGLQERFDAIQQQQSGGLYMRCVNEANGVQCRWILPPLGENEGGR